MGRGSVEEHLALVGDEKDRGFLPLAATKECHEEAVELVVDKADLRLIGAACVVSLGVIIGNRTVVQGLWRYVAGCPVADRGFG